MSADQLRRAAEWLAQAFEWRPGDDEITALLRAAAVMAVNTDLDHEPSARNCRMVWTHLPQKHDEWECLLCRAVDVAAAYLGEEPQL